jgi:putative MATE family efflux protein
VRSASLERAGAQRRDWTQGSIIGNLWALAWPSLITSTLNVIGPAVDMIWIGRLGPGAIAGVGVSGITVTAVNSLVQGLFTGTAAMVARFVGARDEQSANRAAQQSFVIGLAFSVVMAIVGLFLAEEIMVLLGVERAVATAGAAYMRIQFVGMVTMSAVAVSQSIMQASGDPMTPLKMSVTYRLMHIALCPMLVFGLLFFPKLGVNGAAISNVFTQGLGGVFGVWVLLSGRTRIQVSLRRFRLDGNMILRAVKIGIPASLTNMQRSLADLLLVRLVAPFGTLALAAHSLMQRLDMFIQTPAAGLGTASGVLAGQNVGAGQPKRAVQTGWTAAGLATIISVFFSIIIWFWAEGMFGIFSGDKEVVRLASAFLRINIVSYVVWGVVVALSMCLNGVGDTMIPMVTNLTTMIGLQLGLAYVLSRYTSMGLYGIRWAVVSGIVARGIIYTAYYRHGRWLKKKI